MLDRDLIIGLFLIVGIAVCSRLADWNFKKYKDPQVNGTTRWMLLCGLSLTIYGFLNIGKLPKNKHANYLGIVLYSVYILMTLYSKTTTTVFSKICFGTLLLIGFILISYEELIVNQ